MPAPTVQTIRPGVTFTPAAAASFRRAESAWGRRIDVNSTYRNYTKQLSMYRAWNAYVAGEGPYPGHSRAIHPDLSKHCQGLALDSDDWTRPGFNALMAGHGWIRTAAGDPTERHHFEYQSWRDRHRSDPAPASGDISPIPKPERRTTMTTLFQHEDKTLFALAGDSPGTSANWQETTGQAHANDLARVHGNAVVLSAGTWANRKAAYLSPVAVTGGVGGSIDYDKLAQALAKVIPAATGAPTAAENAAEVIRQMKLPGN